MKKKLLITCFITYFSLSNFAHAQLGEFGKKMLDKGTELAANGGLNKLIKQPAAITTNFKDADKTGSKPPSFMNDEKALPLSALPKAPEGGYILSAGLFESTNKSYCLHAGTRGPSKGDGYMFTPTLGPKKEVVTAILKSAEKHPKVAQRSIQVLLWAIIARTHFADFSNDIKLTATTLLTPAELLKLEGGSLGILPASMIQNAKSKLPDGVQKVFEAENNIRRLAASGNASYEEMEKYAILTGIAPQPDPEVPSGIWSLHPDGYYIRYFPSSYSITRVQIYVPKELITKVATDHKTLIYDATNTIACPANVGAQRLAQTNEPLKDH